MATKNAVSREEFEALSEGLNDKFDRLMAALETKGSGKKSAKSRSKEPADPGTDDFTYKVEFKGNWTWLTFSDKPVEEVRKAMSEEGGRFKGATKQWYFNRHVDAEDVESIIGQSAKSVKTISMPKK